MADEKGKKAKTETGAPHDETKGAETDTTAETGTSAGEKQMPEDSKDKQDENTAAAEGGGSQLAMSPQTGGSLALIQQEQEGESLYYMGVDTTSVLDIAIVDIPETSQEVTTWLESADTPKKATAGDLIDKGVELAEGLVQEANKSINYAAKYFAEYAIFVGLILLKLKELTKVKGLSWTIWAGENLKFLSERNRERFMRLARRKDCHRYTYFGVDRLEKLCSATDKSKKKDPIGVLLAKYGIEFDEGSDQTLGEFKRLVDAALSSEKLEKNEMEVPFLLVEQSITIGIEFDKSFIRRMKEVRDSGGDPQTMLTKLVANKGKPDPEEETEKKLQDFNTLSTRLIKTIDYMMEKTETFDQIHEETFTLIIQKLQNLQKAAKITIPEAETE